MAEKVFVCGAACFVLMTSCVYGAQPNVGYFWHVTDFHYDHTYMTSQPLSCNANVTSLPPLGDYWCDATWTLVTKAISAMATLRHDVDFVLWTGDTVAHISNDKLNVTINLDVITNVTTALTTTFPTTTVFSAFGNHDYYPANQYPATTTEGLESVIYNSTAQLWTHWIVEHDQINNFRTGGYYTRLVKVPGSSAGKVRMVLLNTNLYYTSNTHTPGTADPADQMRWLRTTLQAAKTGGEKVILAAHIPPGVHTPRGVQWYQEAFVQPFNKILKDFADVIVAMHFGHDHHDGFKVFPDNSGHPAIPLFVAPSVTPWRYRLGPDNVGPAHNPSLRLVTYDRDSGTHLDIQQYHLDLQAALTGTNDQFVQLYSFTQHYKVSDLSATSIDSVVTRMRNEMQQGSTPLLNSYFNYSLSGADDQDGCDNNCKKAIVCGLNIFTKHDYDTCTQHTASTAQSLTYSNGVPTVFVLACTVLTLVIV